MLLPPRASEGANKEVQSGLCCRFHVICLQLRPIHPVISKRRGYEVEVDPPSPAPWRRIGRIVSRPSPFCPSCSGSYPTGPRPWFTTSPLWPDVWMFLCAMWWPVDCCIISFVFVPAPLSNKNSTSVTSSVWPSKEWNLGSNVYPSSKYWAYGQPESFFQAFLSGVSLLLSLYLSISIYLYLSIYIYLSIYLSTYIGLHCNK